MPDKGYVELEKVSDEGTQHPAATNLSTSKLSHSNLCTGWSVLSSCETSLDEFSLKNHAVKNGFKYIDKLLVEHLSGEWPPFCFPGYVPVHSKVSVNEHNPNCFILLSNRTKSSPNIFVSMVMELNQT